MANNIADDNTPYKRLVEQAEADVPDADAGGQNLFIDEADGVLKRKDSSGAVIEVETDVVGGYDEGTSFPVSPTTNDKFYRTDRNLLYYYDGTRWLTVTLYIATPTTGDGGAPPYSTSPSTHGYIAVDPTYGMYLVALQATTGVFGTLTGSAYWTIAMDRRNAANTNNNITSYTNAADTASNWVQHNQAINAVLDSSAKLLVLTHTKTGAPGSLYISTRLLYRLIG